MYQDPDAIIKAVESAQCAVIDNFGAGGGNINTSLVFHGSQTGYTALHLASIQRENEKSVELVRKLTKDYGANVNSSGADGAQPIHLACLTGSFKIAEILLKSGANVDAEMTQEFLEKYYKYIKCFHFKGKVTLTAYAVVSESRPLFTFLLRFKPNLGFTDLNNKTLLMYAVASNIAETVSHIADYYTKNKPELINARDYNDFHAINYLEPIIHGHSEDWGPQYFQKDILDTLRNNLEIDVNEMANNDEETLLLNKAALKCCYWILQQLLDDLEVPFIPQSKPLVYIMKSKQSVFMSPLSAGMVAETELMRGNKCFQLVMENITFRRMFGMFVPEEEITISDQLLANTKNRRINKIVKDYENYIIGKLPDPWIYYDDDERMTIYDLGKKVFDARALKQLVRNDQLVEGFWEFSKELQTEDKKIMQLVQVIMCNKIHDALTRRELFERLDQISLTKKLITLPFDVIWEIIKYFNNDDLESFLNACDDDYYRIKIF